MSDSMKDDAPLPAARPSIYCESISLEGFDTLRRPRLLVLGEQALSRTSVHIMTVAIAAILIFVIQGSWAPLCPVASC